MRDVAAAYAPSPMSDASGDESAPRGGVAGRPLSALPSRGARALAFLAILVAGAAGGSIGWAVTDITCQPEGCAAVAGGVGLLSAAVAAGGVGVIVVLVLRAMGEWSADQRRRDQIV